MHQQVALTFGRVGEHNLQVVELPYKDPQLSMIILLPPEKTLETVMSQLTISKLLEWTNPSKLSRQTVELYLPRFKMESRFSLAHTVNVLGMGSLFDCTSADLTGISVDRGLSLSALAHGAVCEVNKVGTEAAAATMAESFYCIYPRFMAEHPFLFLIMHKPTRSILFLGRYCGPQ